MTTITRERPATRATLLDSWQQPSVEELARRHLLEKCAYASCFAQVTFSFSQGTLTLCGRLPSFYLKQMLQTYLRDLYGVTQIENHVEVVRSARPSRVRPR
jgi:hypothetical protein